MKINYTNIAGYTLAPILLFSHYISGRIEFLFVFNAITILLSLFLIAGIFIIYAMLNSVKNDKIFLSEIAKDFNVELTNWRIFIGVVYWISSIYYFLTFECYVSLIFYIIQIITVFCYIHVMTRCLDEI